MEVGALRRRAPNIWDALAFGLLISALILIAQTARDIGLAAETAPDIKTALAAVAKLPLPMPPRILICGSLYLAGDVLALNETPPE